MLHSSYLMKCRRPCHLVHYSDVAARLLKKFLKHATFAGPDIPLVLPGWLQLHQGFCIGIVSKIYAGHLKFINVEL